jgi:CRISPR-associated endonuclease/helicase Cas3
VTVQADIRDFGHFFYTATGFAPYQWQTRVAMDGLPEVLNVPTGFGKTEGSSLAWAWRRLVKGCGDEPLHLIYCLPMRNLVRQTVDRLRTCFGHLKGWGNFPHIHVYQLMSGAADSEWESRPDEPWVLVGTQDQLLSRALNRGYSMSRYKWPLHFGLLNHDCHWIIDEIQLMGPGLWTTAQLDWMRQKRFRMLKPCRSTWMSATVGLGFLATSDREKAGIDSAAPLNPQLHNDPAAAKRLAARRPIEMLAWTPKQKKMPIEKRIAQEAWSKHKPGTLSLVVCNTVEAAQKIYKLMPAGAPKLLLTGRFRQVDRKAAEECLSDFEDLRKKAGGVIDGDPGIICVSTQVIEAGLDISAHLLWTALAPWPSLVQRLGRLNRDGLYNESARAFVWDLKEDEPWEFGGEKFIGPYPKADTDHARELVKAIADFSTRHPFIGALDQLSRTHSQELQQALQPKQYPYPRALDVHGLFATEADLHGGFTDVSAFVRDVDPDADVTVFWREWSGIPPVSEELTGPTFDPQEGCPVPYFRVQQMLKNQNDNAWIWDDEQDEWVQLDPRQLRPGMLIMLRQATGGYDLKLGWTGSGQDKLVGLKPPGRPWPSSDEECTELGYWSSLSDHLEDTRAEAEKLCDAVLPKSEANFVPFRAAVIEAAALHDIGKAHPQWQSALPAKTLSGPDLLAKCPRVLGIDVVGRERDAVIAEVARTSPGAFRLPDQERKEGITRLRWAVDQKLKSSELKRLKALKGVRWAGHVSFRPRMRHEAASALAMWYQYRQGGASFPAVAVYLAAAHHGKVRTVLRSTSKFGNDVFGVGPEPPEISIGETRWPMDFSVAADGADGEWQGDAFILKDFGWTGLVADLLGPWDTRNAWGLVGAVPESEPHWLGPFVLAWLEGLVRIADIRASTNPTRSQRPSAVSRNLSKA